MLKEIYMNVENLIDLKNYPIHQPDSAEYLEIVKSVRLDLAEDGCAVLSNFLSVEGLDTITNEAEERKSQAYYAVSKLCNVYLANGNPNEAEDHPQNIFLERTNGFITADLLGKGTYSHMLYHWQPLREFLTICLSKEKLYIYEDPVSNMIVNLCKPGQTFNWHFDTNEFTITFLLKGADSGGYFEYVPNLRTKSDECFDEVKKILNGDYSRVKRLNLNAGDLQFFLGRFSLHRVTHNTGGTDRPLLIQSFTEMPGVIGNPQRVKDLYGKTTEDHKDKISDRARGDELLD